MKDKRIKKVELRLEEFWSSEEYYFHDLYQMQLVQKVKGVSFKSS